MASYSRIKFSIRIWMIVSTFSADSSGCLCRPLHPLNNGICTSVQSFLLGAEHFSSEFLEHREVCFSCYAWSLLCLALYCITLLSNVGHESWRTACETSLLSSAINTCWLRQQTAEWWQLALIVERKRPRIFDVNCTGDTRPSSCRTWWKSGKAKGAPLHAHEKTPLTTRNQKHGIQVKLTATALD